MSTKNKSEGVVIFSQQYSSTHLPGESGGICYTGGLLEQAGVVPVQGVAYRVTVEAIGAEVGSPPEPWMYQRNWTRPADVKRARQTLRTKGKDQSEARKHAREVIATHNAANRQYRQELRQYYAQLGRKQFKKETP